MIICTCIQLKVCTYKPFLNSPYWWERMCQKPSQSLNACFLYHLKSWIPYIDDNFLCSSWKLFIVRLFVCFSLDFIWWNKHVEGFWNPNILCNAMKFASVIGHKSFEINWLINSKPLDNFQKRWTHYALWFFIFWLHVTHYYSQNSTIW